MYNKVKYQGATGQYNPLINNGSTPISQETEYIHEAVVVDVVVNDTHPSYATDGYNVGCVKFRLIKKNQYRSESNLSWAWPLESNISEYPLVNEMVHIIPSLNRFYYTRKINTAVRVTSQPLFGLNEELSPPETNAGKVQTLTRSVANPVRAQPSEGKLGKLFVEPPTRIYRLRHDEGDVVYEGRGGQSIRFGHAWRSKSQFKSTIKDQAPNLLIRVGQNPDARPNVNTDFGLITEDINKDLSSVWLTTDQLIPLAYATQTTDAHLKSIDDFPSKLEGNQIVINTDRFVVNTKREKLMGFSKTGIHWTTGRDFTVDAVRDSRTWVGQDQLSDVIRDVKVKIGQDHTSDVMRDRFTYVGRNHRQRVFENSTIQIGNIYQLSSVNRISLISPRLFLGMQSDSSQPVPLGEILAQFLSKFIDAHINAASQYVITPMGPGQLSPSVVSALTKLRSDVSLGARASFNSTYVFVGQSPPVVQSPPQQAT